MILEFMNNVYRDYGIELICAGGAPLALHLNQTPKDYDLFIKRSDFKKLNPNNQYSFTLYDKVFTPKWFGYSQSEFCIQNTQNNPIENRLQPKMPEVFSYKNIIDLVQINDDVKDIRSGFDFDICECILTREGDIVLSMKALMAIETKTITHRIHNTHFNQVPEKSAKRIERYKQKFPDYKIVEQYNESSNV